jgi:hypothetical protein
MSQEKMPKSDPHLVTDGSPDDDRRRFLATCGKFAVITPPALTILLSTSLNSEAIAHSGGGSNQDPGKPGHGNGPGRDRDWLEWLERWLDRWF